MSKNIFKYKAVYYFALSVSIVMLLISLVGSISLFQHFSFEDLIITLTSFTIYLIATMSLLEKYRNVILWLNICSIVTILYAISKILFLNVKFDEISHIIIFFSIYLVIINIFKNKNFRDIDRMHEEIEELGKPQ